MITLPCNQPTFFDVDDTLVRWNYHAKPFEGSVRVECHGFVHYVEPLLTHVNQLKAHKARGHTIIVWTKGGAAWGSAVIKALGLEEFVDLVIEKPQWCYDDTEYSDFLPKRYFLEDKE